MMANCGRNAQVPAALRAVQADDGSGPPTALDNMDMADVDLVTFDWSTCCRTGDTIIAATASATPNSIAIGTPVIFGELVQVSVGPASAVHTYEITCSATFRSGRVLNWPATLFATNL